MGTDGLVMANDGLVANHGVEMVKAMVLHWLVVVMLHNPAFAGFCANQPSALLLRSVSLETYGWADPGSSPRNWRLHQFRNALQLIWKKMLLCHGRQCHGLALLLSRPSRAPHQ